MWPWAGRRKELERAGSLRTPDVPGVPRGASRRCSGRPGWGQGAALAAAFLTQGPRLRYNRAVGWEQVITIVATVVLAVLVAVLYNNRRFDDVNRRFDDVNGRIDDVHRRIDDLRADMNARFAQVDARFGEVHARLSELREDLREIRGMLQEALRARAP
jgi:outer membrane murein-binding lipoprotein Lpp